MPLAFEATIFLYFEKAVVQTAQNKAQLRILGQHLPTANSWCVSALVLSPPWRFPWKCCAAGSGSCGAAEDGAAVQLLVRQSGNPCLGPEWLTHSYAIYAYIHIHIH